MRGLLEDDNKYDLCLAEAATCSMPPQLRRLFVTILIFNTPRNPVLLWTELESGSLFRTRRMAELSSRIRRPEVSSPEHS